MPSGFPSTSVLTSRKLRAFALDTSIIEAASFKFDEGVLRLLGSQLPTWLQLVMPSIVEQEVFAHRALHVNRAEQQIKTGYAELRRHGGPSFSTSEPPAAEDAIEVAGAFFEHQMDRFIEAFRGVRLDLTMVGLAEQIFGLYFDSQAPFGTGANKKHEFPDAAILLTLQDYAAQRGIHLITVSKDDAWKAFAARSAHLYCVSSLDELTGLFEHKTSEALEVRRKLIVELERSDAELKRAIRSSLGANLSAIQWVIRPRQIIGHSVQVNVTDAQLMSVEPQADSVRLWLTSPNNDACVAEIAVDIKVMLTVEGAIMRDRSGRSDLVASGQSRVVQEVEVKVFVEFSGTLKKSSVRDWIGRVDLADAVVSLDIGKAPFDPPLIGDVPHPFFFDEFDDDIPF